MSTNSLEERFKREDAVWNGPRFHMLLAGTLVVALAVIYFIASVRSGDFVWQPFAHDPAHEILPGTWLGG